MNPCLEDRGGFYVATNATVVHDVEVGAESSIWYGTVVRGDVARITIGRCTNLQDLTVVHPEDDEDVTIEGDVVYAASISEVLAALDKANPPGRLGYFEWVTPRVESVTRFPPRSRP